MSDVPQISTQMCYLVLENPEIFLARKWVSFFFFIMTYNSKVPFSLHHSRKNTHYKMTGENTWETQRA